jgi:hypothetical protein
MLINQESSLHLRAKGGALKYHLQFPSLAGVKIKYTQYTSSTYFLLSHHTLIKNKIKFSSYTYIRKFRVEQLQNHI